MKKSTKRFSPAPAAPYGIRVLTNVAVQGGFLSLDYREARLVSVPTDDAYSFVILHDAKGRTIGYINKAFFVASQEIPGATNQT